MSWFRFFQSHICVQHPQHRSSSSPKNERKMYWHQQYQHIPLECGQPCVEQQPNAACFSEVCLPLALLCSSGIIWTDLRKSLFLYVFLLSFCCGTRTWKSHFLLCMHSQEHALACRYDSGHLQKFFSPTIIKAFMWLIQRNLVIYICSALKM